MKTEVSNKFEPNTVWLPKKVSEKKLNSCNRKALLFFYGVGGGLVFFVSKSDGQKLGHQTGPRLQQLGSRDQRSE